MKKEFKKMIYNCLAIIITGSINVTTWVLLIKFLTGDVIIGLAFGFISFIICLFKVWEV